MERILVIPIVIFSIKKLVKTQKILTNNAFLHKQNIEPKIEQRNVSAFYLWNTGLITGFSKSVLRF